MPQSLGYDGQVEGAIDSAVIGVKISRSEPRTLAIGKKGEPEASGLGAGLRRSLTM